jgi:hypothetical protein
VAGFATFKVKYAVQDIEDQLNRVRRHTIAEQQEIRVLTAEWTYLNQPERLAELNRRFLGLAPIAARQLQRTIADIPLRAPPAAPAGPPEAPLDAVMAATSAPAAPPTPVAAPPIIPVVARAPAGALPAAPAVLASAAPSAPGPAAVKPAARVQLAKAGTAPAPGALDALIAQIADTR